MKKTLPYILSVSLFVYLIIVFTFASAKLREVKCEGLSLTVPKKMRLSTRRKCWGLLNADMVISRDAI